MFKSLWSSIRNVFTREYEWVGYDSETEAHNDAVHEHTGTLFCLENTEPENAANRKYFAVRVYEFEELSEETLEIPGRIRTFFFTEKELERAEERARKNPEDIPSDLQTIQTEEMPCP